MTRAGRGCERFRRHSQCSSLTHRPHSMRPLRGQATAAGAVAAVVESRRLRLTWEVGSGRMHSMRVGQKHRHLHSLGRLPERWSDSDEADGVEGGRRRAGDRMASIRCPQRRRRRALFEEGWWRLLRTRKDLPTLRDSGVTVAGCVDGDDDGMCVVVGRERDGRHPPQNHSRHSHHWCC